MKKKIILSVSIICCAFISISLVVYGLNQKSSKGFNIRTDNITSIDMTDRLARVKIISKTKDKKHILNLIKKVDILDSNIEPLLGLGYGVHIKYGDGTEQYINFLENSMMICSSIDGDDAKWYTIDQNLLPELEKVYSEK